MAGKNINTKDGNTNKIMNKKLAEYNSIVKENDEIYHKAARKTGISDCAFWIFYIIRETEGALTQSNICDAFYQPKQTVNSALKKLEKEGYIELETTGGKRSKLIKLTAKGRKFAEETVDKVIASEQKALSGLTLKEQETFLNLFHKFTKLLKENMEDYNGHTII